MYVFNHLLDVRGLAEEVVVFSAGKRDAPEATAHLELFGALLQDEPPVHVRLEIMYVECVVCICTYIHTYIFIYIYTYIHIYIHNI